MLKGLVISPGFALGKAHCLKQFHLESVPGRSLTDIEVESEVARFHAALETSREEIGQLLDLPQIRGSLEIATIFQAHMTLLDDPDLIKEVGKRTAQQKRNIEAIVCSVIKDYSEFFRKLPDPQFQGKAIDIMDVGHRILRNCQESSVSCTAKELNGGVVIVAEDLTPSEIVGFDPDKILGIAMSEGTATSHAAILARSLSIPALIQVKGLMRSVAQGEFVILDGSSGAVHVNPSSEMIREYNCARNGFEQEKDDLKKSLVLPSLTTDGQKVGLYANIGQIKDMDAVLSNNADGIGLYRTEFAYLTRRNLPDEDELTHSYSSVVKHMGKNEVVIRTIDLGGDKLSHLLGGAVEKNPELGWRAVRMALDRKDVFTTQLRALLRTIAAFPESDVKILFPMISGLKELRDAKGLLYEMRDSLVSQGVKLPEKLNIGAMIEVPSAALSVEILAEEVDFFSIGSNDLVQYTLAVDRTNSRVAHLYQPLNPAVLRLLSEVVEYSAKCKKPLSICGELAGDSRYTILLLGLGLTSFSMNSTLIPRVKQVVRRVSFRDVKKAVMPLLKMGCAEEIELAVQEINSRFSGKC